VVQEAVLVAVASVRAAAVAAVSAARAVVVSVVPRAETDWPRSAVRAVSVAAGDVR
jgi:hypothetical protein